MAAVIEKKISELGSMSFREATVLVLFVSLVLLWFFRKPGFFTSYGDLLGLDKDGNPSIEDATPAILICILLFVLPGRFSFYEISWERTDNTERVLVNSNQLVPGKNAINGFCCSIFH